MPLHPQQAKAIAEAENAVRERNAAVEEAKRERATVRDRYRKHLPLGKWIEVARLRLKRRQQRGGEYFDLSGYRDEHEVTPAMEPFIKRRDSFEVWDVRELPS